MTTYNVFASCVRLIRLLDAHMKFKCKRMWMDFNFKFDEYKKSIYFFDSPSSYIFKLTS